MVINHPGEVCGTVPFVDVGTAQVEHFTAVSLHGCDPALGTGGKGLGWGQEMPIALKGAGHGAGNELDCGA